MTLFLDPKATGEANFKALAQGSTTTERVHQLSRHISEQKDLQKHYGRLQCVAIAESVVGLGSAFFSIGVSAFLTLMGGSVWYYGRQSQRNAKDSEQKALQDIKSEPQKVTKALESVQMYLCVEQDEILRKRLSSQINVRLDEQDRGKEITHWSRYNASRPSWTYTAYEIPTSVNDRLNNQLVSKSWVDCCTNQFAQQVPRVASLDVSQFGEDQQALVKQIVALAKGISQERIDFCILERNCHDGDSNTYSAEVRSNLSRVKYWTAI